MGLFSKQKMFSSKEAFALAAFCTGTVWLLLVAFKHYANQIVSQLLLTGVEILFLFAAIMAVLMYAGQKIKQLEENVVAKLKAARQLEAGVEASARHLEERVENSVASSERQARQSADHCLAGICPCPDRASGANA